MDYKEYENFYLFLDDQRTEKWEIERKGRITASNVYNVIHSTGERRRKIIDEILGLAKREIDDEGKRLIEQGIKHEPIVRSKVSSLLNIEVKEVGFVVPKWNMYIGASTDGVCSNGNLLEIKSPEYIYNDLKIYSFNSPASFPENLPKMGPLGSIVKCHHYDQMQMQMAIWGRGNCYYAVDSVVTGEFCIINVKFDINYWKVMYFNICRVIKNDLLPALKRNGIEIYIPHWGL